MIQIPIPFPLQYIIVFSKRRIKTYVNKHNYLYRKVQIVNIDLWPL